MNIKELVSEEAAWLARQEARTVNKMMRVYQNSFLELEGKLKALEGKNNYSTRHMRLVHAQLGAVMETMRDKHSNLLGAQVRRVFNQQIPRDKKAWQKLELAFGDPKTAKQYADFKPIVPQESIKALVNTQKIGITGFNQSQQNKIRSIIAQSMSQGEGVAQTMRRLNQFKGQAKNKNHLHLIVRMETARASNQGKVELIKQLQLEFPNKEFWLMVKDLVDKTKTTRNHWLSWALSGTVRNVTKKEFYQVHNAELNATRLDYKNKTGRKASDSGILMKSFDLGLRTKSIPAHFGDRGVQVGWSPDWKGSAFGEAKHPQGPVNSRADQAQEKPVDQPPALTPESEAPVAEETGQQTSPVVGRKASPHPFEEQFFTGNLQEEKAIAFTDAGVPVLEVPGDKGKVEFPDNVIPSLKDLRVTHNHVNGLPPSIQDFDFASRTANLKEFRACCTFQGKKTIHSIERTGDEWVYRQTGKPVDGDLPKMMDEIVDRQDKILETVADLVGVSIGELDDEHFFDYFQSIAFGVADILQCNYKPFEVN